MDNEKLKAQNPMSEYLLKIEIIVSNTEFKDHAEAMKYETDESKDSGEYYIRAKNKTDMFESYKYDPKMVYNLLAEYGYSDADIQKMLRVPQLIPQNIKTVLTEDGRNRFIASYVERNRYYCRLTGIPYPGDKNNKPEEVVLIPDAFYDLYKDDNVIERNQPVHKMPKKYQELFMNSQYYKDAITEHPNAKYLQYIGSNSIPIEVARAAQDGDILRINTNKLSKYNEVFGNVTVSSDIVHCFVSSYKKTQRYIYNTLRGDFSSIYPNYDSFIRFLCIYLSMGNCLLELMKKSSSMIYMNNVTANSFFMLYGLPSVIMEGASMIEFLKNFRKLLMDKGTNTVYRVKDLIGYEYTDIFTLVMVKQQVFENGVPIYIYDEEGNKTPKQKIVFRRLGTTSDNTSYFKFRESDVSYDWKEICDADPRWSNDWYNDEQVEKMLGEMNYSLSNSKYIQLSTHLSMTDIWWQCVILVRGLLDRKQETQFTNLSINSNINGTSTLTIFEALLVLIILMNWQLVDANGNHLDGNIYLPNGYYNGKYTCLDMMFNGLDDTGKPNPLTLGAPFKVSSFNFKLREEKPEFYRSIKYKEYIEPDTFLPMLDKVLDREYSNIGEVIMHDVYLIYKYLETKLRQTRTIDEFRQVTDVFTNLFLVDPIREWYDENLFDTDTVLTESFNITMNELYALKSFFKQGEEPQLKVVFRDEEYPISLYEILNENAADVVINNIYPFRNDEFVHEFDLQMKHFKSNKLLTSNISPNIKDQYQYIIIDKVSLDVGNTKDGPRTFESLLFRENQSLYRYIMDLKSHGENLIMLMRNIVKSLENYTNSKLSSLEFNAIGIDEYFHILKEVISYFKSYMIEFTKDEFVYIFDGLFDMGGHSNMIKLHDEIVNTTINVLPKDSLTMFDVSHMDLNGTMVDNGLMNLHDEAIFKVESTYQNILNSGYEIWYDDGKKITNTPYIIDPNTKVVANLNKSQDGSYKLIINVCNLDVKPPNYYGNTL